MVGQQGYARLMVSSQAWERAYRRSALGGNPIPPIAPLVLVCAGDTAVCAACGTVVPADHDAVQAHGHHCAVDPWGGPDDMDWPDLGTDLVCPF